MNWRSVSFLHFSISQMTSVDSVSPGDENVLVNTVSVVTM